MLCQASAADLLVLLEIFQVGETVELANHGLIAGAITWKTKLNMAILHKAKTRSKMRNHKERRDWQC